MLQTNEFKKLVVSLSLCTEKEIDIFSTAISSTFSTIKTEVITPHIQNEQFVISTDPANWLLLNDNIKTMIVKRVPPPPLDEHFAFPLDKNNRRFTAFSYKRYLTNG